MTTATTPPDELSSQRRLLAVVLLMVALFCEGMDLQAINFAAPDLVRTHLITKAQMGPMLSAMPIRKRTTVRPQKVASRVAARDSRP